MDMALWEADDQEEMSGSSAIHAPAALTRSATWTGGIFNVASLTQREEIQRYRVLVLSDSEAQSQKLGRDAGGTRGARVTSSREALAAVAANACDLVLIDLGTQPGESSRRESLRELIQASNSAGAPVLVVASRAGEEAAFSLLDEGATDVVLRPYGRVELRARLGRAMRGEQERAETVRLANTDALTGLANFRALVPRMEQEFRRAERYGYPLALAVIDLDNLKTINDQYGHEVGNLAITTLSSFLQDNLRETDFAARYGGDEFVVLLPHQSAEDAEAFAERIRANLAALSVDLHLGDGKLKLTLSAGVASARPDNLENVADLLCAADKALYMAKKAGRNRVMSSGETYGSGDTDRVVGSRSRSELS